MNFCPNCGAPLQEQMRFCSSCGQKIPTIVVGDKVGEYPATFVQREHVKSENVINSIVSATKSGFAGVARAAQSYKAPSPEKTAYASYVGAQISAEPTSAITNCPNCGAPIDSFSSNCRSCGTEISRKTQASACKELCNRLDLIEASRPKETIFSFVAGLANTALDRNKLTATDQQKIELISSFVVPNTKPDIMEFLFLCKTRIDACKAFSTSTDEYVARVQKELSKVWAVKLEQTIEKAKLVLPNDPDFIVFYNQHEREKNRNNNVCQYCGGKFKGLVHKTCAKCGKPKDY